MQLILDTPGTKLSRTNALFEVKHQEMQQTFSPEKIDSILLSKGIMVSTDAVLLALENGIEMVFISNDGSPKGRIWNNKFGSIAAIRRNQVLFSQSPDGMDWARERLLEKINSQYNFLLQIRHSLPNLPEQKIDRALHAIQRIVKKTGEKLDTSLALHTQAATLRGWEGTASRNYFAALSLALPEVYQFSERSRRPAKDLFNALLNYLYGILYSQVEGALIKAGIDPAIGVWHADEYNKPVLAYDFIEPYRVWADTVAFRLCQQYALQTADTIPEKNGVWLAPSGKKTAVTHFNAYMEEIIPSRNLRRTRLVHIQLEAQELAQRLLQYKPPRKLL
ncbi:MAG TPA: CRISPR-associated endonuclease Cas1 [Microscillaceae bacterium]|nr:CRISPR-associated endonuclease Cas1 [Microscillaceae bacterium]